MKVTDPAGLAVRAPVELLSEANEFRGTYATDDSGNATARRLPFGIYKVRIDAPGFAPFTATIEVRSALPSDFAATLAIAPSNTSVVVSDSETLIDPYRVGAINRIGSDMIENRPGSLPGRSLQDLVISQPGWLYEGNAVLHPRGSEYQTQIVLDGVPLTENRSPGFGTAIQADDIESLGIYTANFPAEYGRKMGGVIEVNTARDNRAGFHGQLVLGGGSYDTAGTYAMGQYIHGKDTFGITASGSGTSHYLNPVVPENFSNRATTGSFSARYERDITAADRISLEVSHSLARYEIPNELIQQASGQRQDAGNFETNGLASYRHIFTSNAILDLRGMVRDVSSDLSSNSLSTPVIAFRHDGLREGYFKGSLSVHHGRQELKAGVEFDATYLREQFSDVITNPDDFDPDTPATFQFSGNHLDLEQSAFLQDQIRLGNWTLSVGLRWDHYQLLVNQNAFSPRLGAARYFRRLGLLVHGSYDRIFQTPSSQGLLLSSSPQVASLSPVVLRLPVKPSHGNYYQVGATKSIFGKMRLDATIYDRRVDNFADDDQLLSTAVSFPIAFHKANIYGAEAKLEVPLWHNVNGYTSYSYMVASAYLPVTGGLFLGSDATDSLQDLSGRFWASQDQRHTFHTRVRYQFTDRVWAGAGFEYGSGLPFEFEGTLADALQQSGPAVVARLNFDAGRVRPSFSVNTSAGAALWKSDKWSARIQLDGENLNNRLNVIDFAGLFSGNAIAPSRSFSLGLTTNF